MACDPVDQFLKDTGEEFKFDEPTESALPETANATVKNAKFDSNGEVTVELQTEKLVGEADQTIKEEMEGGYTYQYADLCLSQDEDESDDEDDPDPDPDPFVRLAKKMVDITDGERGVLKKVLTHGFGEVIPRDAIVTFHCTGSTQTETFDSSYLRGKPMEINLKDGEGLPGLLIGLITMKRGEVAQFLVMPEYAFGKQGVPPRIPPNQTILYKVEIMKATNKETLDNIRRVPKRDRIEIPMSRIIKASEAQRAVAKDMYIHNQLKPASYKYAKAIQMLEEWPLLDEAAEKMQQKELLLLYLNQAVVDFKLKRYKSVVQACTLALKLDPNNVKGLFYTGKARMVLSDYEGSREALEKAYRLNSNDRDIATALTDIDEKEKQYAKARVDLYKKMFSNYSDSKTVDAKPKPARKNPVLEELRGAVREQLETMKEDPSVNEFTFPASQFTEDEVKVVAEEARALKLHIDPIVKDGELKHLKIMKKAAE